MTRDETKVILATIATVYPRNLMPDVTELTINVWFQLLQDLPYSAASAAVAGWLTTNHYPPTIADIRELLTRSSQTETPEQNWSRLLDALHRYGHTMLEEARTTLGDAWPGDTDWQYYCQMQESDLPNEKARYLRMVTNKQQRDKTRAQMPANVVKLLDGIGQARLEEPK